LIVLQDGLCSVHAAEALSGRRRRLCAVKVKLTNALGLGAALLVFAHSISTAFLSEHPRGWYTGGDKQFGRRAGRGGDFPRTLREKISTNEGGLSQSPPFLFALMLSYPGGAQSRHGNRSLASLGLIGESGHRAKSGECQNRTQVRHRTMSGSC
jgi:hypothetical protein